MILMILSTFNFQLSDIFDFLGKLFGPFFFLIFKTWKFFLVLFVNIRKLIMKFKQNLYKRFPIWNKLCKKQQPLLSYITSHFLRNLEPKVCYIRYPSFRDLIIVFFFRGNWAKNTSGQDFYQNFECTTNIPFQGWPLPP